MDGQTNRKLALVAMIFAVSMTFIDQTIVSISIPVVQEDLDLSYVMAAAMAAAFVVTFFFLPAGQGPGGRGHRVGPVRAPRWPV